MPEKAAFLTFLIAALALNIAPGPDMLYVIGRSVGQGRRAGIVSSLGVFVGLLGAYSGSGFWDRCAAAVLACGF